MQFHWDSPSLTLALALAMGMICQAMAYHLRLPSIVLLLATGVLLGPDMANLVRPETLGNGLTILIGFAVAVILFEGGMNLDLKRLRREQTSIRRLVTWGALVTLIGGMLAARLLMGWSWRTSFLFGTLVIVTGPTVIGPLLKRLKVQRSVATILSAEGVLIDAVGAIIAAVALEVALSPRGEGFFVGAGEVLLRLGFGGLIGLLGGLSLGALLRVRHLVPEGLENVFTLGIVLALFQLSNAVMEESGIAAVTVAGLAVGAMNIPAHRDLAEFKEQLTNLLIGMLFVLLAADVRLQEVLDLGWPGLLVVVALMLLVRPMNILVGTAGSNLSWRQKAYLAWIAPRGIIAAAVASLFAAGLERQGETGGNEMRALVFMTIAITVVIAGLTGGWVARALGLKRPENAGWVILGANELARAIGRILKTCGEEVVFLDANPGAVQAAKEDELKVVFGNGLQERTLQRAEIEIRMGAIGLTPNEEVNMLFLQKVLEEVRLQKVVLAVRDGESAIGEFIQQSKAEILFGAAHDVDLWSIRLRRGLTSEECWEYPGPTDSEEVPEIGEVAGKGGLPIAWERLGKVAPVTDTLKLRGGDRVFYLIHSEVAEATHERLAQGGWKYVERPEVETPEGIPADSKLGAVLPLREVAAKSKPEV